VDLHVTSDKASGQIRVELNGPARNPPEVIRLHVRTGRNLRSVKVDGRDHESFDAETGVITLPGDIGRVVIVVKD
jgi:hypothetical protein